MGAYSEDVCSVSVCVQKPHYTMLLLEMTGCTGKNNTVFVTAILSWAKVQSQVPARNNLTTFTGKNTSAECGTDSDTDETNSQVIHLFLLTE